MTRLRQIDGAALRPMLRELQLATLPDDKPYDTNAGQWWIALDDLDDAPIGFGGYVASSQWGDTVYLCRSGVLSAHRGQGLQKRLIQVRERHARRHGYRWSVTDTFDNPASSNSLITSGYRLFTPSRAWGRRGALYWRKKIERT